MADDRPDVSRLRIDRSAGPSRARSLPRALALLLAVAGVWFLWNRGEGASGGPAVQLGRVLRSGGAASRTGLSANGYVVARRRAALSTDIQGRLVEVRVEEGDRVRAGDIIARLDTRQFDTARARAVADLQRAEAEADLARLDRDRLAPLVSAGDASIASLDEARARLAQATASVASLEAAVGEIDVMIDKSTVRAPFDGVITRKNAEVGEVVSSIGATGPNARGAVATLVDFGSLEVQVELAQSSLQGIRVGAPALIYLDPWPEQAYRGRVRQIWPQADRQKGTVELRVEFLDRDARVLPELSLRTVFVPEGDAEPKAAEVWVPGRAVTGAASDEPAVFLYRTGHVLRRPVTLDGEERSDGWVVSAGLEGNELVVLDPPASLQDGDAVALVEE